MTKGVTPLIRYAVEADVPGLSRVNFLSFRKTRFNVAMFREADEPTTTEFMAFDVLKHLSDPETHVLVVNDPGTKETIATARWVFPHALGFDESLCTLSGKGAEWAHIAKSDPLRHAPQPCNEAVFDAFKKMMHDARKKHTTDRDMGKSWE